MTVVVSLAEMISEMAEIVDNHTAFLNRKTGEVLTMNDQQRALFENSQPVHDLSDGQHAVREAMESGDLLELPSKFEHHEFSIVERFCESINEPRQQKKLLKAIRGKRAFRDFQKVIGKLGLTERWIGFRNRELEELAVAWLDENEIQYKKAA
jgi:hypothetical protein